MLDITAAPEPTTEGFLLVAAIMLPTSGALLSLVH